MPAAHTLLFIAQFGLHINATHKHNRDLIPDDAHIVHSPPSSQSLSTPLPSNTTAHQQQQHQHNHHSHHPHFQPNNTLTVVPPTMSHSSGTSTQRASTLPRNPQLTTSAATSGTTSNQRIHRAHGQSIATTTTTPSVIQQKLQQSSASSAAYMLGLYGWRKRCLFVLIFALITLIVTNVALTLWILKVMEFSAVSNIRGQ